MPVNQPHPDYVAHIDAVTTTRDACSGQKAVKARRSVYLPGFLPEDKDRYEQYIKRAVYYNVTGRTLEGLVGAIFRKPAEVEIIPELEYMLEDADGRGLSLEQVSKHVCGELLQAGRCGILVDYPEVDGDLTKAQVDALGLQAAMAIYSCESIINWSDVFYVLKERTKQQIDEFTFREVDQYRVLALIEGRYVIRLYDENGEFVSERMPRGFDGRPLSAIPFVVAGAVSNVPDMQTPPLFDIAEVNIAHYRNSADQEESLYIHGQGTLFLTSDMTAEQFKELNPSGVVVGARRGHFLGSNGSATLLQTQANGAIKEAMQDKLDMMVALGAKLIQSKSGNETAEAARIKASSDASTLDTIVGNASEAIEQALEFATLFMGGDASNVLFSLNRDFFDSALSAQDVMALIQLADRGDVAQADIRAALRKAGWIAANRTDEILDEEAEEVGPPLNNVATVAENADNQNT